MPWPVCAPPPPRFAPSEVVTVVHWASAGRVREICKAAGAPGSPLGCTIRNAAGATLEIVLPTPQSWGGTDRCYAVNVAHELAHNGAPAWPPSHPR